MSTPADLIAQGEELYGQGKVGQARDRFIQAIAAQPDNTCALQNLGVVAYETGDVDLAVRYFTQVLTASPTNTESADEIVMIVRQVIPDLSTAPADICYAYLLARAVLGSISSEDVALLDHRASELAPKRLATLYDIAANTVISAASLSFEIRLLKEFDTVPRSIIDRLNTRVRTESPPDDRDDLESQLAPLLTKRQTQRVLHGSYEIANQMYTSSRALIGAGWDAKTLCLYPNYLKYRSDYVLDVNAFPNRDEAVDRTRALAESLIPEFDIFHFHFGTSLTMDQSDLPLIQAQGKKMVMHYWGSEVRRLSLARQINKYTKVKTTDEQSICRRLERIAEFMPSCIVGDEELAMYVKDFFDDVHIIRAMIDMDQYPPPDEVSGADKPFLIVHAPTAPELKGSQYVFRAMEDLQSDYEFEFKLVQNMSHEEAKEIYSQADLIVDELHIGCYGLLSIECMSMAKPVITWICEHMQEKYPDDLPIMSANPDTIQDKIRWALENRDALPGIGLRSREYVKKHHDMRSVVKNLIRVYEAL